MTGGRANFFGVGILAETMHSLINMVNGKVSEGVGSEILIGSL